jgi:hypothetical protein
MECEVDCLKPTIAIILAVFVSGCGASSEPAGLQTPLDPTRIKPGIYAGQVSCDVVVWTSTEGSRPGESSQPNFTFNFNAAGIPDPGVGYNPQNDVIEFGAVTFNVTNRTAHTSVTTYVEQAAIVGFLETDRLTGNITWTFTYVDDTTVRYRLDIFFQGASDGVAGSHTEACSGALERAE